MADFPLYSAKFVTFVRSIGGPDLIDLQAPFQAPAAARTPPSIEARART
jgi:hypothetical protein